MKLTFLGTGTSTGVPTVGCHCPVCQSPDPHDRRTRPSVMLEYDGRVVLIDAAPDFRAQALRESLERVDAILFTHAHADHILGLDDLRPFYFRQKQPIPIYADARCMASLKRVFTYIFQGDYPYGGILRIEPRVIEGPIELWGERFTPLTVYHGDLPVLGFLFRRVAYITDFSRLPYDVFAQIGNLDILILDALRHKPHPAHSNLAQSLTLAERLKPQRAYFTHIAHELGHEETNRTLPAHIRLAYDGLKVKC